MVALLYASSGADEANLIGREALGVLHAMKRGFRSYKLTHIHGMVDMPWTPDLLQQSLPAAYNLAYSQEAPPVQSQVDMCTLDRIAMLIPLRSTRHDSAVMWVM